MVTRCQLAAAAVTVASLGCGGDPFTPTVTDLVGSYTATTFTTTSGATTTDQLAAGASLSLSLAGDGTTTGRLFVPGGAQGGGDLDADMVGTWTLTGRTVTFNQTADTFVRDMPFTAAPNQLRGNATFSGTTIRVTLSQ